MRNIFDQYSQPENRLSHALAVCLNEDRDLLKRFVARVCGRESPPSRRLFVIEQSLPGEEIASEDDAERRGLPDIVIHDGATWCLLIESKIQARLTADQLDRHVRTIQRRDFTSISSLALTKSDAEVPRWTHSLLWRELYEWLGEANESPWARRLRDYLRVAEVRLAREGYLTEGTLTMFDGFKFADGAYSYGEAKRLLKLAMDELRKHRALLKLGIVPGGKGRGAISGHSFFGQKTRFQPRRGDEPLLSAFAIFRRNSE